MTNRPHIICHMLASVDGKIDGASLHALVPDGEYEAPGSQFCAVAALIRAYVLLFIRLRTRWPPESRGRQCRFHAALSSASLP